MYVRVRIRICIFSYIYIYKCIYLYIYMYLYRLTSIKKRSHKCTCIHIYTYRVSDRHKWKGQSPGVIRFSILEIPLMSDERAMRRDSTDAVSIFEALEGAVGWPGCRVKQETCNAWSHPVEPYLSQRRALVWCNGARPMDGAFGFGNATAIRRDMCNAKPCPPRGSRTWL